MSVQEVPVVEFAVGIDGEAVVLEILGERCFCSVIEWRFALARNRAEGFLRAAFSYCAHRGIA